MYSYSTVLCFHYQGHSDETWGLATHPTKALFVTCSYENLVCVWNGEKQEIIWSAFIEVCISYLPERCDYEFMVLWKKKSTYLQSKCKKNVILKYKFSTFVDKSECDIC